MDGVCLSHTLSFFVLKSAARLSVAVRMVQQAQARENCRYIYERNKRIENCTAIQEQQKNATDSRDSIIPFTRVLTPFTFSPPSILIPTRWSSPNLVLVHALCQQQPLVHETPRCRGATHLYGRPSPESPHLQRPRHSSQSKRGRLALLARVLLTGRFLLARNSRSRAGLRRSYRD
jgi:hypothetical protein